MTLSAGERKFVSFDEYREILDHAARVYKIITIHHEVIQKLKLENATLRIQLRDAEDKARKAQNGNN